jgi:hypothetical protein
MSGFLRPDNIVFMKDEIKYVRDIRILKESAEPDLMAIKARGIASLKKLIAPVLIPKEYDTVPEDGIFELEFLLDEAHQDVIDVEMDVEVVFRIKNIPAWVKGIKINATENSDIELI